MKAEYVFHPNDIPDSQQSQNDDPSWNIEEESEEESEDESDGDGYVRHGDDDDDNFDEYQYHNKNKKKHKKKKKKHHRNRKGKGGKDKNKNKKRKQGNKTEDDQPQRIKNVLHPLQIDNTSNKKLNYSGLMHLADTAIGMEKLQKKEDAAKDKYGGLSKEQYEGRQPKFLGQCMNKFMTSPGKRFLEVIFITNKNMRQDCVGIWEKKYWKPVSFKRQIEDKKTKTFRTICDGPRNIFTGM